EIWSVFGHSGLWVRLPGRPDGVFNFGVVSEDQDRLLSRFLQGTLDFYLGVRSLQSMSDYYSSQDRHIYAQRLALPRPVARELILELGRLSRPENRRYRYHWIRDNCATKIRDLLDSHLGGVLRRQLNEPTTITARDEVLRHLGPNLPAWFGWYYAVSSSADEPLTRWDLLFLPDRLPAAFEAIELEGGVPLASRPCLLQDGNYDFGPKEPPSRDFILIGMGVLWAACIALSHWRAKKAVRKPVRMGLRTLIVILSTLFIVPAVFMGSASVWLWLTSEYRGFWHNLNLLSAGPQFAAVPVAFFLTRSRAPKWQLNTARWMIILLFASLAGSVLALCFGGQHLLGPTGLFFPVGVVINLLLLLRF
ncbi:MAG: DUF4105 domain-containing protein, partial [Myxococcales bacterium]|nr:DUF4105 domain-containing protein [Myxococcales bacterium]